MSPLFVVVTSFLLLEIIFIQSPLSFKPSISFVTFSASLVECILKDSSMTINFSLVFELPILELGKEFIFSFLKSLKIPSIQFIELSSVLFLLS